MYGKRLVPEAPHGKHLQQQTVQNVNSGADEAVRASTIHRQDEKT